MNEKELARVLDEHMHRYISNPEVYEREWQTVQKFRSEAEKGDGPSYGRDLATYLFALAALPPIPPPCAEQAELPFTD